MHAWHFNENLHRCIHAVRNDSVDFERAVLDFVCPFEMLQTIQLCWQLSLDDGDTATVSLHTCMQINETEVKTKSHGVLCASVTDQRSIETKMRIHILTFDNILSVVIPSFSTSCIVCNYFLIQRRRDWTWIWLKAMLEWRRNMFNVFFDRRFFYLWIWTSSVVECVAFLYFRIQLNANVTVPFMRIG